MNYENTKIFEPNVIDTLLLSNDISESDLLNLIAKFKLSKNGFCDIYFQKRLSESWAIEEGIVKSGSFSIDQGFGLRNVLNDQTGFSFSDHISKKTLNESINAVNQIYKSNDSFSKSVNDKAISMTNVNSRLYENHNPISSIADDEKIKILKSIEKYAFEEDNKVIKVSASLGMSYELVLIIDDELNLTTDIRPLIRLSVSVIVGDDKNKEMGSFGGGGRLDLNYFDDKVIKEYAKNAVFQAITNLNAKPAPAGEFPVVLGSGWPGILLHEAIGHGLEGDFNRKKSSAFSNLLGKKVASSGVTVVDDGTIPNRRGSLNVDDEGTNSKNTVLIDDGVLVGYMQDKLNARLMNHKLTGNARRESYAHCPMPRMTNTYMLDGKFKKEEILSTVKNGIYAANFGGGQVDIVSGKFVFSASEAYKIENGKLSYPIKGATLIGNGPDILKTVSMIGDDSKLDSGVGTCGKDGQSVPVGVGQPSLKIDAITVGGTSL